MIGDLLGALANWAADLMERLGYPGLAFLSALENILPLLPSEVIMPFAGFLASEGRMNFFLALLAATVGSIVGALVFYYIGAWFGERRVRVIVQRWGKFVGMTEADLDNANAWFDRHGPIAVLVCRVVPLIRSMISIPAGIRRMRVFPFIVLTTIGSTAWNMLLIGAGWFLGENWAVVEEYTGILQYIVLTAIILAGTWWVWNRIIKKTDVVSHPE